MAVPPKREPESETDFISVRASPQIAALFFMPFQRVLGGPLEGETNTNYLEIECRLATRGRGAWGRLRASNHANLRPAEPRLSTPYTHGRNWLSHIGTSADCGGIELARSHIRAMIEGEPIPNRQGSCF
jgi:hypothetical protein